MPKKTKKKEPRGFTQVGMPLSHHNALQEIADEEGSTRCGILKKAVRPLILKKLQSSKA